ncbi:MAG: aspartate kinase [Flavisolibacter sp.]
MKVFKFGGASVSTEERIRNVATILKKYNQEQLLVVVSAMGKTTNALELVVEAFYRKEPQKALQLFGEIREQHVQKCRQLGIDAALLNDFFTEVEWLLHDKPLRDHDYYYDQVVCVGELLSTVIVSSFLKSQGISNEWIDVRDVIRTDNNFRDAKINWEVTEKRVKENILPLVSKSKMVLTQGFIGATDENESTTLGREGSDYTAAVFANLLDAEAQVIWKDVQGVMNADPKLYAKAEWIRELNYQEVIEMAYYGAQVIHPKTIKPLQNKNIPLYVRSFIHPDEEGTCIHNDTISHLPPIIVYKNDQVLIELRSKDYSFVSEGLTETMYEIFGAVKFKPNLTQTAAISILCVTDDHPEKLESLALKAAEFFDVHITRGLTMLTIRHYNEQLLGQLVLHPVVLRQQTPETVQVVMKNS